MISPFVLILAVRGGTLDIYNPYDPSEVLLELAQCGD